MSVNTIIFYEDEYAKSLLNGAKQNKRLTFYDLCLVAMYIRDIIGKSKEQTYSDMVDFCKKNNPDFNEVLGANKLRSALNKTDTYGIRRKKSVEVTKNELEIIKNAFSDYKHQKVMFAMLVIAKFFHNKDHYKKIFEDKNNSDGKSKKDNALDKYEKRYYVNQSLNKIFKTAKVHVQKKSRYKILYDLQQNNFIDTTLRGTFEILFVFPDSPVEIIVDDLNNIESFFPYYCIVCGRKYKREPYSKNQLCDTCYQEKRKKDEIERMRNYRKEL
jgi:hypothetical protein